MKGKWLRRSVVAGLVVAMGNFCGCGMLQAIQTTTKPPASIEPTQGKVIPMEFPHTLPDSTLVVEEVVRYRGRFWEDGSGEMVEDVAGIMLYNPTNRMVEFEAIALEQ